MLYRYGKDKNGRPVKKAVVYTKEEHLIPLYKIDPDAMRIVQRLKDNGFTAYIVGGAVRDLLVGNTPKDFDIVTDATPSKIKRIFRNSRIIGKRFRLVHVIFGLKIFEVSTFRSTVDGSVGNSFGTIDEDVMRRDFTINALYYDPIQEHVIDYVGGVRDIKKSVLRPVISIDKIFVEDPVRMLRAIKYSSTTGCQMSWALRRKIRHSAHLLSPISPSRLTEEMLKIINSSHSFEIVSECLSTDLYMYLQPAATAMMYNDKAFEKNYLMHLKELDKLVSENKEARLGKKLVFLIKDFILTLTDWKREISNLSSVGELYVKTWTECRNFVLPMNPQRTELEFAIRTALREIGVSIKIPKKCQSQSEHSQPVSQQEHSSRNKKRSNRNGQSKQVNKNIEQ
ncbi:polynucleotide adenylyltransferase PcnB [Treponema sp.]|uniref:polynucleotide adenylyltransferase PcnB n=1 Tax=Treponema sp. TaxID=166 RepID=UPI00298D6A96|nr:polynucleotide adenylyltransferase PcnB [Treponema sp.]MCR5612951.1 polynucleotide adenylyltransferase PcnB [Treponema sp.]